LGAEGEHDEHLHENVDDATDVVVVKLLEPLRAVTVLEEEDVTHNDIDEALIQVP
jgi:hypothetical protein